MTVPTTRGNGPSPASAIDLSMYGYVEEEFFLDGEATSYVPDGDEGLDGKWKAKPNSKAPYKTRVLLRRPAFPERFNGTVFVEWLNVTLGSDLDVAFTDAWEELLRAGFAYAGVSVQPSGVNSLKSSDSARYGSLNLPGDEYSYDIFAQAGAALGWPAEADGGVDILQGFHVKRLLAYGMSQSAMRMITYVNAFQPLTHVYDGILIHSRAGWGAPIGTESNSFLGSGKPVQVRSDLDARVLQFFTESELFYPLGPAYAARQPDTDRLRSWEVAGAGHGDEHLAGDKETTVPGCGRMNDGPAHFVLKAAIHHMHEWLLGGVAPPMGQPLQVNTAGTAIVRDSNGNALGGIRTPAVDVPIATLSGEPSAANAGNPICALTGQTIPFTPQQLLQLYPTHQDYVDKVTRAASAAQNAGFILPQEQQTIVTAAIGAPVPQ